MRYSMVVRVLWPLISERIFNSLDGFIYRMELLWFGTKGHKRLKEKLYRKVPKVIVASATASVKPGLPGPGLGSHSTHVHILSFQTC